MNSVLYWRNGLRLLTRRKLKCYLLSSKFILGASVLLCLYFLTMDIILFQRIKHRGPFRMFNETQTRAQVKSIFWPLPIKKIMMADATHFIRSPIAELAEEALNFSGNLPFISANAISILHCVLSVISIRFLSADLLFWRQFGVCLFQFRNFLDSFDGVLYRAHANKSMYTSHYGSLGYFVDAVSDVFGGCCLVLAIAIYFNRRPPPHTNLTRCFRLADEGDEQTVAGDTVKPQMNCVKKLKYSLYSPYTQLSSHADEDGLEAMYTGNASMFASKLVVFVSVALIGIRIGLSALFWDRSVHAYQDLLDNAPKSELHQVNLILISNFFSYFIITVK